MATNSRMVFFFIFFILLIFHYFIKKYRLIFINFCVLFALFVMIASKIEEYSGQHTMTIQTKYIVPTFELYRVEYRFGSLVLEICILYTVKIHF